MQTSFIHDVLRSRSKKANWPYISSLLIKNYNIPLFEEYFGQLDYDWLLRITKDRRCKETDITVVRYIDGTNLSLDPKYRKRDFYMGLLDVDGNLSVMKKWIASRARYHYVMGDMKMARFFFARGSIDWKTILYFISSYNRILSKWIIKKFNVFG
jgi:hypothetical protein